jgi:transcriptional regulator with XRE-family HTH domain
MKTHIGTCSRCQQPVEIVKGTTLRQVREAAGISLREMARRLMVSAPYLSLVERSQKRVTPKVQREYEALR